MKNLHEMQRMYVQRYEAPEWCEHDAWGAQTPPYPLDFAMKSFLDFPSSIRILPFGTHNFFTLIDLVTKEGESESTWDL